MDELQKKKNRSKSSVRAKVEHPFRILKRVFGFDKVRYRGIAKNHQPAVRELRPGEPVPAPQTAGSARVEVRPEAGNRPRRAPNQAAKPPLPAIDRSKYTLPDSPTFLPSTNHSPEQSFPRHRQPG